MQGRAHAASQLGLVQVEDWTGQGLQDLREGVIRTPLPAQQTFLDGGPPEIWRCLSAGAQKGKSWATCKAPCAIRCACLDCNAEPLFATCL